MLDGVSGWHLNAARRVHEVQEQDQDLVASGQLGIFANGYWGAA